MSTDFAGRPGRAAALISAFWRRSLLGSRKGPQSLRAGHSAPPKRTRRSVVGASLTSTLIAIAIGSVVLVSVGTSLDTFTRATTTISDNAGNVTSAGVVLQRAMGRLNASLPLGACVSDQLVSASQPSINGEASTPVYSFETPYQNCAQVTTVGTPFWGAAANGVCYFAYPQLNSGAPISPPDLYCLYIATSTNVLYLAQWKPEAGATYTTCDPASCFGSFAGGSFLPPPGSVPLSDPASCAASCPSDWFDLGTELNAANAFSYAAGGSAWTPGQPIPPDLAVTVTIHAENDNQKNWLGPKIYDLNFSSTPTGGGGASAQTWYSLSG